MTCPPNLKISLRMNWAINGFLLSLHDLHKTASTNLDKERLQEGSTLALRTQTQALQSTQLTTHFFFGDVGVNA